MTKHFSNILNNVIISIYIHAYSYPIHSYTFIYIIQNTTKVDPWVDWEWCKWPLEWMTFIAGTSNGWLVSGFLAPRLNYVDAPASSIRKHSAWNWRVCIQHEETEDSIEYNVTWHTIFILISVILFFAQVLWVASRVNWKKNVRFHNCQLDYVVMPNRLLPKFMTEHKIMCVIHWWVEHTLKEREENLRHVCVVDPVIGEGIGKQTTLI
jgi:hypothetical protein